MCFHKSYFLSVAAEMDPMSSTWRARSRKCSGGRTKLEHASYDRGLCVSVIVEGDDCRDMERKGEGGKRKRDVDTRNSVKIATQAVRVLACTVRYLN